MTAFGVLMPVVTATITAFSIAIKAARIAMTLFQATSLIPMGLALLAIVGVVAGVIFAFKKMGGSSQDIFNLMTKAANKLIGALNFVGAAIFKIIRKEWKDIGDIDVGALVTTQLDKAGKAVDDLKEKAAGLKEAFLGSTSAAVNTASQGVDAATGGSGVIETTSNAAQTVDGLAELYRKRTSQFASFMGDLGSTLLSFYRDQGMKGKELFQVMEEEYRAFQSSVNEGLEKEKQKRRELLELMHKQIDTTVSQSVVSDRARDAQAGDPGAQQWFIDREEERRAGGGNFQGYAMTLTVEGEDLSAAIGSTAAKNEANGAT